MKIFRICLFFLFLKAALYSDAQAAGAEEIEASYKSCLLNKTDTSGCARNYLRQMDSILNVVYESVRQGLPESEKIAFTKEQLNWQSKKAEFNKKQDENWKYNLQEGTWGPSMIWVVNESKANFIKKRVQALSKKLK